MSHFYDSAGVFLGREGKRREIDDGSWRSRVAVWSDVAEEG